MNILDKITNKPFLKAYNAFKQYPEFQRRIVVRLEQFEDYMDNFNFVISDQSTIAIEGFNPNTNIGIYWVDEMMFANFVKLYHLFGGKSIKDQDGKIINYHIDLIPQA